MPSCARTVRNNLLDVVRREFYPSSCPPSFPPSLVCRERYPVLNICNSIPECLHDFVSIIPPRIRYIREALTIRGNSTQGSLLIASSIPCTRLARLGADCILLAACVAVSDVSDRVSGGRPCPSAGSPAASLCRPTAPWPLRSPTNRYCCSGGPPAAPGESHPRWRRPSELRGCR